MKLSYSLETYSACFGAPAKGGFSLSSNSSRVISHVVYDTRKIRVAENALFFALNGAFRKGETYLQDAYDKGVRCFVVSEESDFSFPADAVFWKVKSPLYALQELAKFHRSRFNGQVIAVTGSIGKTTFKEWLFFGLQGRFTIVRSPKSFNSQLGVALSLLELNEYADLAIIEAGISKPGEMARLREIIRPDMGVLTGLGSAHLENFESEEQLKREKLVLFEDCRKIFVPTAIDVKNLDHVVKCDAVESAKFPKGYSNMLGVLKTVLDDLAPDINFDAVLNNLPGLALRMEIFDGVNNTTIINDTYNLDKDALIEALHLQQAMDPSKKKVVVLGLSDFDENTRGNLEKELEEIVTSFNVDQLFLVKEGESIPWNLIHDSVVLIKAHRKRQFEKEVAKGRALKHLTYVEVNLSALKHNLEVYKSRLSPSVRLLSMVKADAYGTGAVRVAQFLERNGVNYLGVAFADEGVALRENGVQLPIVVMNPDSENIELFVEHRLEPAIYSFDQLDEFITGLILLDQEQFPVHLKFDTGMHRLGFAPEDKEELLSTINAQPEIRIQGIYSHLADADNPENSEFTNRQLNIFDEVVDFFRSNTIDSFVAHVLNSEGSLRYPDRSLDMVRIGISMYGFTENRQLKQLLQPAIQWFSRVSQVKTIRKGESVGYGRTFIAEEDTRIAIVPVGYADGFRRNLSNGKGAVYIQNQRCEVVGRVCMDMIMVNIGDLDVKFNEKVEIIGANQTIEELAGAMGTIPYEVLTGLSKRMQRVYIEE